MIAQNLLLVDDEPEVTKSLIRALRNKVANVVATNNPRDALEKLEQQHFDIVISDLKMPEMDGNEFCSIVAEQYPEMVRIMLTAHHDLDNVLNAVNKGRVWGMLEKPWDNQELLITLQQAAQFKQIVEERSLLRRTMERYYTQHRPTFEGFIGDSITMQFVYSSLEQCAPSNASVFITGPSGAGKEVAAEAIHHLSKRKNGPFIALNCAAIPNELMESEIFGHIKGAFSGAVSNRDGAARLADGGTLFLDEIGEMNMTLQAKLLRFIQTGTYQPVGSSKTEKADIRFVCATNRNPLEAIQDKKLREDLYYRLNVISIDLPPLCERDADALQIAQHFLAQFSEEEDKVFAGFSSDAEALLKHYRWPGNVRELRNTIHSAVVMSEGPMITGKVLGSQLRLTEQQLHNISNGDPKSEKAALKLATLNGTLANGDLVNGVGSSGVSVDAFSEGDIEPLSQVERRAIERAVLICNDNVVQAASALGVSPSTLYRKMQQWQTDNDS